MKQPTYRPPQFDPRTIRDSKNSKLWDKAVGQLMDEAEIDSLLCPFDIGDKVKAIAGTTYKIPEGKKVVEIGVRKVRKIEYSYFIDIKPESVSINGWRVRLVGIKKYWLSVVGLEKVADKDPT